LPLPYEQCAIFTVRRNGGKGRKALSLLVYAPLRYALAHAVWNQGIIMALWSRRLTILPGVIGVGAITLGSLITAFAYVGEAGEAYSPFNHFVSELGHTQFSGLSAVFNGGLVIGGLCFALHMIGVGLRFKSAFRYLIVVMGVIAGGFGALVGIFPMNIDSTAHTLAAFGFFAGSLVMLTTFSVGVVVNRHTAYPRWLAGLSVPMILSTAIFLNLAFSAGQGALAAPAGERAAFLPITASEWGVIIFLLMWVTVMAIYRATRTD